MLTIEQGSGAECGTLDRAALGSGGQDLPGVQSLDDGSLLALAQRILGSYDLACDAVQEARWAFYCLGVRVSDPRAWMRQAVLRRCLQAARSERRRTRYESEAAQSEDCPLCDPGDQVQLRELSELLADGMKRLCRDHRDVMRLRAHDGLDYEAIASRLSISVGTVRSRLSRARRVLREHMGPSLNTILPAATREVF